MSMRKDVYERMRYFVLEKIKPNYSAIARQYDVDPRNVKAAYLRAQSDKTAVVRKRRSRRSKLDGYQDIIEDKYAAGSSARSIYDFIVEKGFTGKYTIVKDYCRRFRKAQTKKSTIRVEHTIGLSAQVDWKEQVTMTDRNGVPHTFSIFLYVLPYSKFKFLKLTLNPRQESLKRRIKRARFLIIKRLSDFNYQFQPLVNRQQINEFATMSFLNNQENIIFIGSPVVDKTHLSIGLGTKACRQGVRTLFINCHELILRLKAAQEKQHL